MDRSKPVDVPADAFEAFQTGWRARAPERLRNTWHTLHLFALRTLVLRPVWVVFPAVQACAEALGLARLSAWSQAWRLLVGWPEMADRFLEPDSRAIVDSAEGAERGAADALAWWTRFTARDPGPKFGPHALGEGLGLMAQAAVRAGGSPGAIGAVLVYTLGARARGEGVPLDEPNILAELSSALVEEVPLARPWSPDERAEALTILLHGFLQVAGRAASEPDYLRLLELIRATGKGGAQ